MWACVGWACVGCAFCAGGVWMVLGMSPVLMARALFRGGWSGCPLVRDAVQWAG